MKPSKQRLIYSIVTAFSVVIAVTIIMVNLPAGSPEVPVIQICFLTGSLGFLLTFILYQRPPENSDSEGQPNILIRLVNLLTLSVTVIMSIVIAFMLIELHLAAQLSGH